MRYFRKTENSKMFKWIISLVIFILMFFFFYRISAYGDYPGHYSFAVDLKLLRQMSFMEFINYEADYQIIGYPVWHIIFLTIFQALSALLNLISPTFIGQYGRYGLTIGIENGLIITLTFWLMIAFLKRFCKNSNAMRIYGIALAMLFAGPLYLKFINPTYDTGQLLITAWYNPTTLAVKPLALGCFWLYIELIENNRNVSDRKRENKLFLLFAGCLFLSGLIKPSFFQMFAPALLVYCIIDIIMTKGKSFWFCFRTGVAILPTCALAILQLWISFYSVKNNGMLFGWLRGWKIFTQYPLGSLLLSILFPIIIYVICRKKLLHDKMMLFAGVCFFSGIMQFALFYEEAKIEHGNFAWGAFIGTFLLFLVSCVLLENECSNKGIDIWKKIALTTMGLHVFWGLYYYINMFATGAMWTSLF